MIGHEELGKRIDAQTEAAEWKPGTEVKHATLLSQFKAFANYLDVELEDGEGKDTAIDALLEASQAAHDSLQYEGPETDAEPEVVTPEQVQVPDPAEVGVVPDGGVAEEG